MNLCMKQKQNYRYRENNCGCQERVRGRMDLGVWGQQMKAITYRKDKQGPTA